MMDLLEKYKLAPSEVPAFLSEDYSNYLDSVIDPDNLLPPVQDKIDEQTEILKKCANNQIVELEKQNKELKKELETQTKVHISNYEELHQIYEQQQKEIDNNKRNNKKDGIINKTISIIAIIVAICAWLFPR